MKNISSFRNAILHFNCLTCIFVLANLYGCYSFKGGTIPEHLKTLNIAAVSDNSGYGNPSYRELLNRTLIEKFQEDNSFDLVEGGGDSKLYVKIISIAESVTALKPGEYETEKKITLTCEVEFYDAIKKQSLLKKKFSNYSVYSMNNLQEERDAAIRRAIEQASDDILLAVVSGW